MKVELLNIDDVCAEIEEYAAKIWMKTVRMQEHCLPLDDHDMRHQVGLIVTGIVRTEGGDWLMEFADAAGETYVNDPEEIQKKVHDKVAEWKERVREVCKECDLKLRSGKWETY